MLPMDKAEVRVVCIAIETVPKTRTTKGGSSQEGTSALSCLYKGVRQDPKKFKELKGDKYWQYFRRNFLLSAAMQGIALVINQHEDKLKYSRDDLSCSATSKSYLATKYYLLYSNNLWVD